jgi:two-component system nitrogen regulation sensor histidine kinase GlnL
MNRKEGSAIVSVLDEEVRRASLFVEDFLSACREPRPHLRKANLNDLVEEFVVRWNEAGREGGVIAFEPFPGALPVRADFSQISRVLHNIAGNALDVSRGGCRIRIATSAVRGGASVTVEDDGPGIPEELLPKVFEPFCTARKNGTGLGLSIVRGIVEAHGGKIEARNRRFGGAAFTVRLPAPPDEPDRGNW